MGKIRTTEIKSTAKELFRLFPDKFSADFDKNKAAVNELKIVEEKTQRNKIVGYLTRFTKAQKLHGA